MPPKHMKHAVLTSQRKDSTWCLEKPEPVLASGRVTGGTGGQREPQRGVEGRWSEAQIVGTRQASRGGWTTRAKNLEGGKRDDDDVWEWKDEVR